MQVHLTHWNPEGYTIIIRWIFFVFGTGNFGLRKASTQHQTFTPVHAERTQLADVYNMNETHLRRIMRRNRIAPTYLWCFSEHCQLACVTSSVWHCVTLSIMFTFFCSDLSIIYSFNVNVLTNTYIYTYTYISSKTICARSMLHIKSPHICARSDRLCPIGPYIDTECAVRCAFDDGIGLCVHGAYLTGGHYYLCGRCKNV